MTTCQACGQSIEKDNSNFSRALWERAMQIVLDPEACGLGDFTVKFDTEDGVVTLPCELEWTGNIGRGGKYLSAYATADRDLYGVATLGCSSFEETYSSPEPVRVDEGTQIKFPDILCVV